MLGQKVEQDARLRGRARGLSGKAGTKTGTGKETGTETWYTQVYEGLCQSKKFSSVVLGGPKLIIVPKLWNGLLPCQLTCTLTKLLDWA